MIIKMKKRSVPYALIWALVSLVLVIIIDKIGTYYIEYGVTLADYNAKISTIATGLRLVSLRQKLSLGILSLLALKFNSKKLNLTNYKLRLTYVLFIFLFFVMFDIIYTLNLTKHFILPVYILKPQFNYHLYLVLLLVPALNRQTLNRFLQCISKKVK